MHIQVQNHPVHMCWKRSTSRLDILRCLFWTIASATSAWIFYFDISKKSRRLWFFCNSIKKLLYFDICWKFKRII